MWKLKKYTMTTMIVNGKRYLLNTEMCDKAQDETAQRILGAYPKDAVVEFEAPTLQDVAPRTLGQLINKYK
jgi:hypothetical protein